MARAAACDLDIEKKKRLEKGHANRARVGSSKAHDNVGANNNGPSRKGISSSRVRSGPRARAIVGRRWMAFRRSRTSSCWRRGKRREGKRVSQGSSHKWPALLGPIRMQAATGKREYGDQWQPLSASRRQAATTRGPGGRKVGEGGDGLLLCVFTLSSSIRTAMG